MIVNGDKAGEIMRFNKVARRNIGMHTTIRCWHGSSDSNWIEAKAEYSPRYNLPHAFNNILEHIFTRSGAGAANGGCGLRLRHRQGSNPNPRSGQHYTSSPSMQKKVSKQVPCENSVQNYCSKPFRLFSIGIIYS